MAKQTKDKGNRAESEAKLLKNETKKLGKSSTLFISINQRLSNWI